MTQWKKRTISDIYLCLVKSLTCKSNLLSHGIPAGGKIGRHHFCSVTKSLWLKCLCYFPLFPFAWAAKEVHIVSLLPTLMIYYSMNNPARKCQHISIDTPSTTLLARASETSTKTTTAHIFSLNSQDRLTKCLCHTRCTAPYRKPW